jgi:hypothetical protein
MIDLNNPNVPLMTEEGLTKTMLLYQKLYKEGRYYLPAGAYVANLIGLSAERDPIGNNIEEFKALTEDCAIKEIVLLIDAMKEDINTYGLEAFIKEKRRQSNSKELLPCLNTVDILAAMRYPKDMIKVNIERKAIHRLPKLIQYLYGEYKTIDDQHSGINKLPYIINKEVFDGEHDGQGRPRFRVYLNNPLGKSGVVFLQIFIKRLIEQRIPYNYKFNYNTQVERKDKSIFYFPIEYLNEVTQILDGIYIEYPELISQFGSPDVACAQSSYYGISHIGASLAVSKRTYNMYVNDITSMAYFIYFCKQLKMHGPVYITLTDEEKALVGKYSQGVNNEEVFDEIIHAGSSFSKNATLIRQIISKCGGKFKVYIQTHDYGLILKQVASVRMYGDLDHIDYPICFNETFYGNSPNSKKKI